MKKNIKKFMSMMLALVMTFALAAPAFAAESEPAATDGSVTVYVTQGMFTEGGLSGPQKYDGSEPIEEHILTQFNINGEVFDISYIEEVVGTGDVQSVYDAPKELPANVLDAIIVALQDHGVDGIIGGWDAHPVSGDPGGYINSVPGAATQYNDPRTENVDGKDYTVYSGTGWNIAVGTSTKSITALTTYGSSVELAGGMTIVFDLSPYSIYELVTSET